MRINSKNEIYTFQPNLGLLINSQMMEELSHLKPIILDEEKLIAKIKEEFSDEELEKMISSLKCFTLNITESCSYRCRYCVYSGNYQNTRTHSSKKMKLKTAQKAIDYIIHLIASPKRQLKDNIINLGFYGGEPALEAPLIEKIIIYTHQKLRDANLSDQFKIDFNMNTNGYLLKEKILDMLVNYNISVAVSLDGPQYEHDKFRVTRNGRATWYTIMRNLQEMKSRYPDYYEKKLTFLCTLHPSHDFQKIDNFFTDNNNHFYQDKIIANRVSLDSLKENKKRKLLTRIKTQESFLLQKEMVKSLEGKLKLKKIGYDTKFTSNCSPGNWKLFFDTDGGLHFCEKVNSAFPIGHVDTGLDFEKIKNIYRAWSNMIIKNRCWECSAWSFCSVCFAYIKTDGKIDLDCSSRKNDIGILIDYLNFKEKQDWKKRTLRKVVTIEDYIDGLETLA